MFEKYFDEGSEWIPINKLSGPTRRNLALLEEIYGIQWDNKARKAKFGWAHSYLIEGTGPAGEEVFFERRETMHLGAGQTLVWIDGRRFRLKDLGLHEIPSVSLLTRELTRKVLEARRAEDRELIEDVEDLDFGARTRLEMLAEKVSDSSLKRGERARLRREAEKQREEILKERRGRPLPKWKDRR